MPIRLDEARHEHSAPWRRELWGNNSIEGWSVGVCHHNALGPVRTVHPIPGTNALGIGLPATHAPSFIVTTIPFRTGIHHWKNTRLQAIAWVTMESACQPPSWCQCRYRSLWICLNLCVIHLKQSYMFMMCMVIGDSKMILIVTTPVVKEMTSLWRQSGWRRLIWWRLWTYFVVNTSDTKLFIHVLAPDNKSLGRCCRNPRP